MLECVTNTRTGFARDDKAEPVWIGLSPRRVDNFYRLARFEGGAKWGQMSIDPTCDTGVTYVRMYGVGEVNGCCALGEFVDLTFRREEVDLVWKQVDFYILDEFQRIARTLLHL